MNIKNVYGYIRVSTKKQGEGVSLEVQQADILRYAERNNMKVVKWFEEKQTAAKKGRTQFRLMLKDVEQKKIDGFIAHKIDRVARNLSDWGKVRDLGKEGAEIHFAFDNINLGDPKHSMLANMIAVIAEGFIDNLKTETHKGLRGRLSQGILPFMAPIGYLNNGKGKLKTIDPKKGPLVQMMFELYTKKGYTTEQLKKEMNARGLTNTRGGSISKNSILAILKNPFYAGVMSISGENYTGHHKTLISMKTWKKAQAIMSGKTNIKTRKHSYLLRRMLTCTHCGYKLIGERQKGHVYYRCHQKACPTKSVRESMLEQYIIKHLQSMSFDKIEANTINHLIQETRIEWTQKQHDLLNSLNLRIGDLKQKQQKLRNLLLSETLTRDEFLEEKQKVVEEIQQLSEQKTEVSSKNMKTLEKMEYFLELVKNPVKLYDLANSEEKRDFLKICTSNLEIEGKKLVISTLSPFSLVVNTPISLFGAPNTNSSLTKAYTYYPMTSPILLGKRSISKLKSLFSQLLEVIPSLPDINHLFNHEIPTNYPSTK